MVDANSIGLGPAKTRSINVEVNLLNDWAQERVVTQLQVRRKASLLVAIVAVGVVVLPVLSSWKDKVRYQALTVGHDRDLLLKERNVLIQRVEAVTPSMDFSDMKTQCGANRDVLLRECGKLITAAQDKVLFDNLKVDVASGDITVKIVAHAPNSAIGRQFVEASGKGKNVTASNQTAIRQSQVFGPGGIVFDYTKKVKVGK